MRKPCCERSEMRKGAWSQQEDQILIDYIREHGEGSWRTLPQAAGLLRCGKSCRLRWINYLRPDLKRGNFSEDEEDLIIKLHALLGNRWSLIAGRLPGRTDNEVKNYWNSHVRRKLINMGIDPSNHRPTNLNPLSAQKPSTSNEPISSKSKPQSPTSMISCPEAENELDTRNGSEDDCDGNSPPNLNLDLTISIPSPPYSMAGLEEPNPKSSGDMESATSPTLLLFR